MCSHSESSYRKISFKLQGERWKGAKDAEIERKIFLDKERQGKCLGREQSIAKFKEQ